MSLKPDLRARTRFALGKASEEEADYGRALFYYKMVVKYYPEAAEKMGECYYFGRGCTKNQDMAKEYFAIAAKEGLVDGICNYALCLDDTKEKMKLYRRAANLGSGYACNQLGILFQVCPKDEEELQEMMKKKQENVLFVDNVLLLKSARITLSEKWFDQAANLGEAAGLYNRAILRYRDDLTRNSFKKEIEADIEMAVKKSFIPALKMYIHWLEQGEFLDKNEEKADKLREIYHLLQEGKDVNYEEV